MVHRNNKRLQRLVDSLLDFSRIEAGCMLALPTATDLAALTGDIVSMFRAAIEAADLEFDVQVPPLPWPMHVDRDMWEKIVSNLLSSVLKYTLHGFVDLRLAPSPDDTEQAVLLTVADSGCGIPADEIPKLFQRFYRVTSATGRSHKGTGIGLALTD